jgi:hypothetical protein
MTKFNDTTCLLSLSCLRKAHATGVLFNSLWEEGKGVKASSCAHAATATTFRKRKGHPFSLFVFIAPISVLGVFGGCSTLSLFLIKLSQNWFFPLPKASLE